MTGQRAVSAADTHTAHIFAAMAVFLINGAYILIVANVTVDRLRNVT